jgi:anti-sigma factor RsiW
MTCEELSEFLMDYLDGALTCEARAAFKQHLAVCPECRAYLSSYQATIELGRSALCGPTGAFPEPPPRDLVAAVIASRRADLGWGKQDRRPSPPDRSRTSSD